MCLLTKQQSPTILTEDKIVWKAFQKAEQGSPVYSIYHPVQYILNKLYITDIEVTDEPTAFSDRQLMLYTRDVGLYDDEKRILKEGVISIADGFHSFYDKDVALGHYYYSLFHFVYECVIPAGSEYYEDETGLCVSNQIIVKDRV